MSAPQIPNLNTLRRGGGRGRFRSRGDGRNGLSSNRNAVAADGDQIVQGTDTDASVSRLSAVRLGYLEDPFAGSLTPFGLETRRLPIINRGTYVRTAAIDRLVNSFLESDRGSNGPGGRARKQIISLGAGTDTRVFRLLASRQTADDLVYHEVDFSVNTSAKIKAIRGTPLLQRAIGITGENAGENVTISVGGDALHSPRYHIHPVDLRSLAKHASSRGPPPPPTFSSPAPSGAASDDSTLATGTSTVLQGVDTTLPTLLISECCLVYLSPTDADSVVDYFTHDLFSSHKSNDTEGTRAPALGIILYEPIRPDDAFGKTMVSNLATRGIHLQTLNKYSSLSAQRKRLGEQGFSSGQAAADIDFIWERWVSEEEKERVAGLEMLDEMEEWRLLARHYCIAWGWREESRSGTGDSPGALAFGRWTEIEGQEGG